MGIASYRPEQVEGTSCLRYEPAYFGSIFATVGILQAGVGVDSGGTNLLDRVRDARRDRLMDLGRARRTAAYVALS